MVSSIFGRSNSQPASNASMKRDRNSRKAAMSFGEKAPNTRRSIGSTRSRAAVKRLTSDLGHVQLEHAGMSWVR